MMRTSQSAISSLECICHRVFAFSQACLSHLLILPLQTNLSSSCALAWHPRIFLPFLLSPLKYAPSIFEDILYILHRQKAHRILLCHCNDGLKSHREHFYFSLPGLQRKHYLGSEISKANVFFPVF